MIDKLHPITRRRVLPLLALGGLSLGCGVLSRTSQPTHRPDFLDRPDQVEIANYLTKFANRLGRAPGGFLYASSGPALMPASPVSVHYETLLTYNQIIELLKSPDLTVSGSMTPVNMSDWPPTGSDEFWSWITHSNPFFRQKWAGS